MITGKYKTINEYIALFPKDIQKILKEIRQTIRELAPNAKETIKYGIPTFELKGNLVHFAAYKTHIGFYPASTGITKFKKELTPYETSKGTIKLPLNKKIPIKLITKIVKYRIKENLERL